VRKCILPLIHLESSDTPPLASAARPLPSVLPPLPLHRRRPLGCSQRMPSSAHSVRGILRRMSSSAGTCVQRMSSCARSITTLPAGPNAALGSAWRVGARPSRRAGARARFGCPHPRCPHPRCPRMSSCASASTAIAGLEGPYPAVAAWTCSHLSRSEALHLPASLPPQPSPNSATPSPAP